MTRKSLFIALLMVLSVVSASAQQKSLHQLQQDFVDLRFGMFIHFNIPTFAPDDWPAAERAALEAKFSGLFGPSGVSVQINWVNVAPQDNRKATPVWMLPVFWGAAAAGVTALFHMGLGGVLWSIFFAVIGYGVAWLVLTEDGRKQINALRELFRR